MPPIPRFGSTFALAGLAAMNGWLAIADPSAPLLAHSWAGPARLAAYLLLVLSAFAGVLAALADWRARRTPAWWLADSWLELRDRADIIAAIGLVLGSWALGAGLG